MAIGWGLLRPRRWTPPALRGCHLLTQMMIGREHAMVAREIHTRIGYQRGQPRDKVERLEHHMRGAIPGGAVGEQENVR